MGVYIVALGISAGEQLDFELDWLLKLRLVVARQGEQDVARWWNTTGQLSARGASVLARGFPRTHYFAQARSVFAAAETRCAEVFGLAGAVTIWRLDDEVEEAFDQQWERWLDQAGDWSAFFEGLASGSAADLRTVLLDYALVDHSEMNLLDELSVDSSGQSIRIGDRYSGPGLLKRSRRRAGGPLRDGRPMKAPAEWSQRLLRKGVLIPETYRLFADWDFGLTTEENLARGLEGRAATQGWDAEVLATVRRRVRDFPRMRSLITLAQRGLPMNDWRDCLRLWVGATEEPFHSFAMGWLFEEKVRGRSTIRSEELVPVVDAAASTRPGKAAPISDYSRIRAARDLLKTATDLGMIEGTGPARVYSGIAMSDD
ncbi:hypothetical protein LTR37_021554, partial [Vermiconidia calcicola]